MLTVFFLQHLAAKTTKQNYRPPGSIGGDINQFHKFLFVGLYCWSPGGSTNIYSFFSRAQAVLLWVIDLKVCVFFSQFLFGLFLRRNPPWFCREPKIWIGAIKSKGVELIFVESCVSTLAWRISVVRPARLEESERERVFTFKCAINYDQLGEAGWWVIFAGWGFLRWNGIFQVAFWTFFFNFTI